LLPAFAAGAGAEINLMDTGKSFAVGCSLTGEWRFSKLFSAGGFFTLSFGKTVPVSMESGVFMRWYFLRFTRMPMELFVEPAVGVAAVLGDAASQNSGGFVDAGLSLGLRFYMGKFYLEPYARGGYPFMGGAGFHLGYASRRP
jgi:hypothetical protein